MAYPSSLDSFSTKVDNVDDVNAADINNVQTAVVAVETKIGTGSSTPALGQALMGTGTGTSAWQTISTDPATAIHAATEKTTPVDADEIGITDSAASYVLKKLTWANLKATLLTWLRLSTTIIPTNAPQGFLINGKISVTDTGSGLTVAIKTLAGTDPSASDPVYVRIGDTVRTISAALSVTKADGTNWCNSGSAELATKEIDYFVYLGYNATDGVVLGFSRYPGANSYDDFSATTTNEKYCAISTITTAAATDYYEVIGRFAATLSAGAGYTWSVPTYTAKNLIQRPIYETRWLTVAPAHSASGSMTFTSVTGTYLYKLRGDALSLIYVGNGTLGGSASVAIYATSPFTFVTAGTGCLCVNNNAQISGIARGDNTASVEMYIYTGGNWTLSANSGYRFNMTIKI